MPGIRSAFIWRVLVRWCSLWYIMLAEGRATYSVHGRCIIQHIKPNQTTKGAYEVHCMRSSKKRQPAESRIPTEENLVNPPSLVPHNFSIGLALDIDDSMLRDELFVCQVSFPRPKTSFQTSIESILVSD